MQREARAAVHKGSNVRSRPTGENGTLPVVTGLAMAEFIPVVHQTTLTFTGVVIVTTDSTTAFGTLEIFDFPEGRIVPVAAAVNLALVAGAGGIADDAAIVGSLGSAAATQGATLTGTEADIVASTACTLAAGLGNFQTGTSTPAVAAAGAIDGTATASKCFLNFAIPDAGTSAADTLTITGTINLFWLLAGDD